MGSVELGRFLQSFPATFSLISIMLSHMCSCMAQGSQPAGLPGPDGDGVPTQPGRGYSPATPHQPAHTVFNMLITNAPYAYPHRACGGC